MNRLGRVCVGVLLLFLFQATLIESKVCNATNLIRPECGPNETCVPSRAEDSRGECACRPGFARTGPEGGCVAARRRDRSGPPSSSSLVEDAAGAGSGGSGGGGTAAAVLAPALLLGLAAAAAYAARRRGAVAWLRAKLGRRPSGAYDEVMIGGRGSDDDDDDPPLR